MPDGTTREVDARRGPDRGVPRLGLRRLRRPIPGEPPARCEGPALPPAPRARRSGRRHWPSRPGRTSATTRCSARPATGARSRDLADKLEGDRGRGCRGRRSSSTCATTAAATTRRSGRCATRSRRSPPRIPGTVVAHHRTLDVLGRRQLRDGPEGRPRRRTGSGSSASRRVAASNIYGDVVVVTLAGQPDRRPRRRPATTSAPRATTAWRSSRTSRWSSPGPTTPPAATRSSRPPGDPDPVRAARHTVREEVGRCGSSSRAAAARAGAWVVRDLREHGHDVLNVDIRHDGAPHGQCLARRPGRPRPDPRGPRRRDAVVHFAAIPAPGLRPDGETFRINMLSTYNVFAAAVAHRVRRVVWASSETVLGLPFDTPPAFAPIDETIEPRPEIVLRALEARRRDDGEPVRPADRDRDRGPADLEHHGARRLRAVPDVARTTRTLRKWNLWGYVDAGTSRRRAGSASRRDDRRRRDLRSSPPRTRCMTRPSADLMAEVFPTSRSGERSRAARRCCRSTTPAGCSATSRGTAGETRSEPAAAEAPTDPPDRHLQGCILGS